MSSIVLDRTGGKTEVILLKQSGKCVYTSLLALVAVACVLAGSRGTLFGLLSRSISYRRRLSRLAVK